MNNDEIQNIYNQTKNISSPPELDELILKKARERLNKPKENNLTAKNSPVFFAIAASVVLAVALSVFMFSDSETKQSQPLEIAKTHPKKRGQQLPFETYYPFAEKDKIVLMCGELPRPETNFKLNENNKKTKESKLPKPIYPYDLRNQAKPSVLCKVLNDTDGKMELACGFDPVKQNNKQAKTKPKVSSLPKLNYPYELKKIPKANVLCRRAASDSDKLVCGLVEAKQNIKAKNGEFKNKTNIPQLPKLEYPYLTDKDLDPDALCKKILKNAE